MKKFVMFFFFFTFVLFDINVYADYVGSINSNIYHYESCEWAQRISPYNKIRFKSVAEAKSRGYRRCYVCYPPTYDKTVKSIKIENLPENIYVGDSIILSCIYAPEGAIDTNFNYKSSNMDVATIEGNTVYAHAVGKTTITVSTPNHVTCSHLLNVVAVPVESVSINNKISKLLVDEHYLLNVTVLPYNATNKKLTFISSNPDVISVDKNGLLIGKSEGASTITINCENKSSKLSLTVEKILPQKIDIKKYSFVYPGFSKEIEVSIFPENTTDKNYKIESSNPDIVSVDDGRIIAKKSGTVNITVSCGGISESMEIKVRNVYIDIGACLGTGILVILIPFVIKKHNKKSHDSV